MTPSSSESNCPDTEASPNLIAVTGRSGKGTARQTIRIDHELWERFGKVAEKLGIDRSQLVREYIEKLVDEHAPDPADPVA